jgi:heme o synthase
MNNNSRIIITSYIQLSKVKIMIPVSLTAFTGYFIFNPGITAGILTFTAGILLMAISASVLNQIQESDVDARMQRTHDRPLPSGRISRKSAFIYFAFLLSSGSFLVLYGGNTNSLLLSIFTLLWYNGVYTPLKRITAYAIIPGSITGALPPSIGWVAAGGSLTDLQALLLALIFFTGQIPHFWLIMLKYGKEYEIAGIPSLSEIFDNRQMRKLVLTTVIITSCSVLLMIFSGMIKSNIAAAVLLAATILLISLFISLVLNKDVNKGYEKYPAGLNSYYLLIMIVLIADSLHRGI